jgi:nucleotide-binding universal stress UspA family protein
MKKILVPVDFSDPSIWAVETAAFVAERADATVILLHIVEQPTAISFNVEGQVDVSQWEDKLFTFKLIERDKKQLADFAGRLKTRGIVVEEQLRMGNPYHGIKTTIAEQSVDLIVMGTSGRSKLEEILVGSNTEKVVRHATCPVLTVHKKPGLGGFKNVVYATSMSENESGFAKVLKEVQEIFSSIIHIVRINTPSNFRADTEVKKLMEIFAKKLHLKNYTLNVFSDYSEEEGIIHFASSLDADLIGLATHGRTGFSQVLAKSIAEDVANHSSRPVLTYVTRA